MKQGGAFIAALVVSAALSACGKKETKPVADLAEVNASYCKGLAKVVSAAYQKSEPKATLRSGYASCAFGTGESLSVEVDCKDENGMLYRKAGMLPNFSELDIGKHAYRGLDHDVRYGVDTGDCSIGASAGPGWVERVETDDYALLRAINAHLQKPENRPTW